MSQENYKYTDDGRKCIAISELRPNVWEIQNLYEYGSEYWEDDEGDEGDEEDHVIEGETTVLYHGRLHDYPPLPIQHERIAELNAEIAKLESEETAISERIETLKRVEREFENPKSHIEGLGNLKRLIHEQPTHFMVFGSRDSLPCIKTLKDVYIVHDKIATLKMVPERNFGSGSQLFWEVKFGWSSDRGVEATPCFSYDEARALYCKRIRDVAKWDDLGYHYLEWAAAMKEIGIEPNPLATAKFTAKQNEGAEQKKRELAESIERQKKELEKLTSKE